MPGMKIIFLDCDGVVSPFNRGMGGLFNKEHMLRLKKIMDATGARIVLSSSWRVSEFGRGEVTKHLVANGMPTFIDCTPELRDRSRSHEILDWIEKNKEKYDICNFVALDDINLAASAPDKVFFAKHAVCTNSSIGLTDADVTLAIQLLGDDNNINTAA
ncbi:hypothetical protein AGDE_03998 [Angomonas deanei]|uniref:HAD domain in Swiss Army Knife RNA repair proteins, putative n=1 Tax=Angomonas deanei TaxID=59799 RepID=A0A7G2CVN2_9TRYP|nr:hypothetical protein AGDE_03998 [Angomonas deanei]CAD2222372.1 HAD domain in Swiss Army Knife RNA repair proteins, putative [Angomonas deanei]|eukprot:EPY39930.1 hypothetical protein AGDE_03998 [Angomonas deanei]